MIKEAILKVVSGSDLTYDESKQVMEEMMTGGRIIRPAYKAVAGKREYTDLENR